MQTTTTIESELKKKRGRPFNQRTLFLEGYGISIKINDKKLVIIDGKEEQEIKRVEIRNGNYNLPQESYFTEISKRTGLDVDRIIISGSGYITFDALHWLTQLDISVIMLDKKGNLDGNLNYVGGNGFPLFNYGYMILQTVVAKQLNGIGLDCNIGFIHKPHTGFYPLIWDMVEPFRNLIDRSVIVVARDGISTDEYSFEREEILFSYPQKSDDRFKTWLIMKSDLQKRLIKEIDSVLQKQYLVKSHSGSKGRKTDSGFQKMRQTTIIKEFCLELRDYILERKKSVSQPSSPQKILSR